MALQYTRKEAEDLLESYVTAIQAMDQMTSEGAEEALWRKIKLVKEVILDMMTRPLC